MATVITIAADEHDSIKSLVKQKRTDCFLRLGRGAGIAAALESHPERGLDGDTAEVQRRKQAYGENLTYPKPKTKSFLSHVRDALSDVLLIALLLCAAVALGFGIREHRLKDVYDSLTIFITVFVVCGVAAVMSHAKAKLDEKLVRESADIAVTVVRAGRRQEVSVFDVVVGDVVILKTSDAVPADGVLLKGYGLQVDESRITCERRPVRIDAQMNPFLSSGVKVVHGHGWMVVTAVGSDTTWGELINIEMNADEPAPLRERLDLLTSTASKISVAVTVVTFTVRHFTGGTAGKLALLDKGLPLPLAVSLTVTFYMMQMAKDNLHRMSAFETMASVTAICADKTGTLTLNKMVVTEFWVGTHQPKAATAIYGSVLALLRQGAGLNTTGSVYWPDNASPPEMLGSPTEKALLSWAVAYLGMDATIFKTSGKVLYVDALSSATIRDKATGVVIRHWKCTAEVVLANCSMYVDMHGAACELGVDQMKKLAKVINEMEVGGLQCVAFAYKQIADEEWTWLGLVGLKDPCRPEVKTTIEACTNAGVAVKMLTGDSILSAHAIAMECGIISRNDLDDEVVIDGGQFREMPWAQQLEIVDKIRVIFGARRVDKRVLVKLLKHKGRVVALTGSGTIDALAHKDADVVLSMSVKGTDVTKDTIILDDRFDTVVTAIRRGRCAYNYFQRFIQFHLTVNVVAIVVNFVSTITTGRTPLTTAHIMWVNLVMGIMSALAVAADKPTEVLMARPPIDRTAPLISKTMRINLAAQAAFQTAVLLALQYRGPDAFGTGDKANGIMIFNMFVLCQIFNGFNIRDIENRNVLAGVLEKKGTMFLVRVGVTLLLHAITVEVLTRFAGTKRLGLGLWGVCLAIAVVSWPIGWAVKLIGGPDCPSTHTESL